MKSGKEKFGALIASHRWAQWPSTSTAIKPTGLRTIRAATITRMNTTAESRTKTASRASVPSTG